MRSTTTSLQERSGVTGLFAAFVKHFPLFLALYFAAQTLRRLIEAPSLNLDEAEMMITTQAFSWGYGSQPPLYTWLQMFVFEVFGTSLFSFALLKNVILFLTFFFLFRVGLLVFRDRYKAVASTMSVFFLPQIAWEDQLALWHSVIASCAAAATLLALFALMRKQSLANYAALGVAVASGLLSKYTYLLLLLGLVAAALSSPSGRGILFDRRVALVSVPLAVALVLPTALWSAANLDVVLARTLHADVVSAPLDAAMRGMAVLVLAAFSFSILCVAIYGIVAFVRLKGRPATKSTVVDRAEDRSPESDDGDAASPESLDHDLRRVAVLTPLLSLSVAALIVMLGGVTVFPEMYLQPALLPLPLAFFVILEDRLGRDHQAILSVIGSILALTAMIVLWVLYRFPDLASVPPYPAAPFEVLEREIRNEGFSRGTIIGGSQYVAGNLEFRFPQASTLTAEYSRLPVAHSPPFLIAWQGELGPEQRARLEAEYRIVCDGPLPEPLDPVTLEAPYWASVGHIFTLNVVLLGGCGGDSGPA